MKPKHHDCPWYASGKKVHRCTNKYNSSDKKGKTVCPYNKAHKCPLYQEWENYSRIREDALRELNKPQENHYD